MKIARTAPTLGASLQVVPGFSLAQSANSDDIVAKTTKNDIKLMHKDLRDQKKPIVAANLPLTGDQAARFSRVCGAYTHVRRRKHLGTD